MQNELADISTFENLQSQANQSMGIQSPMSVFNAFQVTVPTFVQKADPQTANFKYAKSEEAEKRAAGWRAAKLEVKSSQQGDIFILTANGQRFTLADKYAASKALDQAKQAKVVEV